MMSEDSLADQVLHEFKARQQADTKRTAFLAELPAAFDAAFRKAGFKLKLPCKESGHEGAPEHEEQKKRFTGRIGTPWHGEEAKESAFDLLLDYQITVAILGTVQSDQLLIDAVHFGQPRVNSIGVLARTWRYSKPIMGTAADHAEDIAMWLLDQYRQALITSEPT